MKKREEIWLLLMFVLAMLLYAMGAWFGLAEGDFAKGAFYLVLGLINDHAVNRRVDRLERQG